MSFVNAPTWIRYCACDASRPAPWPMLASWLTDNEQSAFADVHASARQTQWLWGRWISKQLLGTVAEVENFRDIEILTRNEQGLGISPRVQLAGRPWPGSLSISHIEAGVLVGLSLDEQLSLGVDLACDVPTGPEFRSMWFTAGEQQWIADNPAYRTGLVWGLKESVFKACSFPVVEEAGGNAHRWTPRQIEIAPESETSFQAIFFGKPLGRLVVHVQSVARGLAVVVCLPRQAIPLPASPPAYRNEPVRRSTVQPYPFTMTPAEAMDCIAAEAPAFQLH